MTKDQVTQVRRAAMMYAGGYKAEDICKACGISFRTLRRWCESFIWNEALDFIGFDGAREIGHVRSGFGGVETEGGFT